MRRSKPIATAIVLFIVATLSACSVSPRAGYRTNQLDDMTQETIYRFQQTDPGIERLFGASVGYAIFPTIGAGAVGVGGAYGRGQVYERGQLIGYCDMTQASVGVQLGGQAYSEVIFFNSHDAMEWFKSGEFSFSGQASAVALKEGVSANANFRNGVAVYTQAKGGLMYQASIGGQKFRYESIQ